MSKGEEQRPKGVRYSYLPQQFADCEELWDQLKDFVASGDFTLGRGLTTFEESFANLIGVKHAIGVNSGTDAIKLSLKALGVGHGDEVITNANTFVATVGAIAELGATPVFVDCDGTFCLDVTQVRAAVTGKTKAVVPVHFSGYMTDMSALMVLTNELGLPVVEDACQAILGSREGRNAGTWGDTGAFSLHPLKNLNVWSDGGVITTNSDILACNLRLLRNHGLVDRDTVELLGYNSRLDTFQAVVGSWLLPQAKDIAKLRIENAAIYDAGLIDLTQVQIPPRRPNEQVVYHLYMVFAERRDELLKFLNARGIEAKIHYPVPIYLQPALAHLGYRKGDFPVADHDAANLITFPCDQHLSSEQISLVIRSVREFYGASQ